MIGAYRSMFYVTCRGNDCFDGCNALPILYTKMDTKLKKVQSYLYAISVPFDVFLVYFRKKERRTKKLHLKKTYGSHYQTHGRYISQISQGSHFDLTWKYHYFEIIISTNIFICYKITN